MRPRRTVESNQVLRLPGGSEDNDLWIHRTENEEGEGVIISVWEPTPEERQAIANGENVALIVWGISHPPVAVSSTGIQLGKRDGE